MRSSRHQLPRTGRKPCSFLLFAGLVFACLSARGTDAGAPALLIITAKRLLPAFQPLAEERLRGGFRVVTTTVESIRTNSPGRDLPERIRNYIRSTRANDGVSHVLLGGDTGIIPCRHAFVPRQMPEASCLVPADLYFACLDGSWNRDGNARWGEATDGEDGGEVDLVAEVIVGRAPVETPDEVAAFVAKTLRWSEHPASTGVLFLGTALEQGKAQGGTMLDGSAALFPASQLQWLDDRPGITPRWTPADALAALNRGPRLVAYGGHGAPDSLMRLTTEHLPALTNTTPFLLVSVGCHAGEFDNPSLSPDAIGEQLVTREHGAVAALLNARAGWYDAHDEIRYSGEFQAAFLSRFAAAGEGTTLGELHQRARESLLNRVERTGVMAYRWCYYGLNLLGDPSLSVRHGVSAGHSLTNLRRSDAFPGTNP